MTFGTQAHVNDGRWLIAVVAMCALALGACRGPASPAAGENPRAGWTPGSTPTLPPEAFTGAPQVPYAGIQQVAMGPPGMEQGIPLPYAPAGPWAPPGMSQPWPSDEYLADGGDQPPDARAMPDREVKGLNFEDTVAHYDTLDGRTLVEPSNRVYVYSPRFRAVRQVVSVQQNEQSDRTNDLQQPTALAGNQRVLAPNMSKQHIQPQRQVSQAPPITYQMREGDGAVSSAVGLRRFHNAFQAYEDLSAIRRGVMVESEMGFLAEGVNAALTWTNQQAVQVILDNQVAAVETNVDKVAVLYSVKEKPSMPKLRVIKVASTQFAQPGETVDFTIRFDNVGNEMIGNVTILDNLTTRLEYIPDSSQSSVPTEFVAQPNEIGSEVLRWNVTTPIKPGDGGVVRFQCRVR
jgi:uncharacterized repeat protein (TIGR01451 family)